MSRGTLSPASDRYRNIEMHLALYENVMKNRYEVAYPNSKYVVCLNVWKTSFGVVPGFSGSFWNDKSEDIVL